MTETKTYCDHCAKVLDVMSDYGDVEIEVAHKYRKADLCTECFEQLFDIIDAFCEEKGGVQQ